VREVIEPKVILEELDKCVRCGFCNPECPVLEYYERIETYAPRGRLSMLRGMLTGDLDASERLMRYVYTCTLCGRCALKCPGGIEISEVNLKSRSIVSSKVPLPERLRELADNILGIGNPFGQSVEAPKISESKTLMWVGCMASIRLSGYRESLEKLVKAIAPEAKIVGVGEMCCGLNVVNLGLWDEAKKLAEKVADYLKKFKAELLLTICPGCYNTFTKLYPELLGVELPLEVRFASEEFADKLRSLELKRVELKVAYHDPCELGRRAGIYDSPREVLDAIPGVELVELERNRQWSTCCGGGGVLWTLDVRAMNSIARRKLEREVLPLGVQALATACPMCYLNFRMASRRVKPRIEVVDIFELASRAL